MSFRAAELAVDVFKCFLSKYALHRCHAIPDLKHRAETFKQRDFLVFADDFFSLSLNMERLSGFVPLPLDNNFLEDANKRGFAEFSNFIKMSLNDELIVNTTRRFSELVSTASNHEKIVKTVSLFEAVILPGRGKGESKMKSCVVPKLTKNQVGIFTQAIRKAYDVRNGYVHNGVELPLDEQNLWTVLEMIRMFIVQLVGLHKAGKRTHEEIERFYVVERLHEAKTG